MLIIAQPKSASTSLAVTLAQILKYPYHQIFLSKHKSRKALCLAKLHKLRKRVVEDLPHSDMVEYHPSDLKCMSVLQKVFKQHIPPTENNLNIIKKYEIKCVILLRDPKEAAEAYLRHVKNSDKEKVKHPRNDSVIMNKRFNSLDWFHRKYKELDDLDHIKIINFEDLVLEPNRIINEILEFYDHAPVEEVVLRKERYTGVGLEKLKELKEKDD